MGKFLDLTGLQHFWDKVTAKLGNYLPLTGGTVSGPLTVDAGNLKKVVINGNAHGVNNVISIQSNAWYIDLNLIGIMMYGPVAVSGGSFIRDALSENPGDNEVPTVGWVNTKYLPRSGGTIYGLKVNGDLAVNGDNASLVANDSSLNGSHTSKVSWTAVNIDEATETSLYIKNDGTITRSAMPEAPTSNEIPTVGWVKANTGMGKGFQANGGSLSNFRALRADSLGGDYFYDGEGITFTNETGTTSLGCSCNFVFEKTGMFLVSGEISSAEDIKVQIDLAPTFNLQYTLEIKAGETKHFCFPMKVSTSYGMTSVLIITDANGNDISQKFRAFRIYFTRLCTF